MGARGRGRFLLFLLAVSLSSTHARADGHRTGAAATYSGIFNEASTARGWGASVEVPFCWVTPSDDCETNEWSFVAAYSGGLSTHHDDPADADVNVKYFLAGVRFTWDRHKDIPVKAGDFVPFAHLLVGGVKRREADTPERFGAWGSGGAATLTGGLEWVLYTRSPLDASKRPRKDPRFDLRLRAQLAGAVFGIGDKTFARCGFAVALSAGWLVN
jgi:hypothetical protein